MTDIRSLPKRAVEELEKFFEATDALQDKTLNFLGWQRDLPRRSNRSKNGPANSAMNATLTVKIIQLVRCGDC